jgi:hypothetical protein
MRLVKLHAPHVCTVVGRRDAVASPDVIRSGTRLRASGKGRNAG